MARNKSAESWAKELFNCLENEPELYEGKKQEAIEQIAKTTAIKKINDMIVKVTGKLEQLRSQEQKLEVANEIKKLSIQEDIMRAALDLRKGAWRNPAYISEINIVEAGIFSVPKNKAKPKVKDELVRTTKRATIQYKSGEELTVFDQRVLVAIQRLWLEQGRVNTISFSRYDILKKLQISTTSGEVYKDIMESLDRLLSTKIQFQAFYDNGRRRRTTTSTLLTTVSEDVEINVDGSKQKAEYTVKFNEDIQQSLAANYFIGISMSLIEDLTNVSAILLYPFFASQSSQGITEWTFDELCEYMNISSPRHSERDKIVRKGLEELKSYKVISHYEIYEDFLGVRKVKIIPSDDLLSPNQIQLSNNSISRLNTPELRYTQLELSNYLSEATATENQD